MMFSLKEARRCAKPAKLTPKEASMKETWSIPTKSGPAEVVPPKGGRVVIWKGKEMPARTSMIELVLREHENSN